jgi:large subunit ribosomal protein L36
MRPTSRSSSPATPFPLVNREPPAIGRNFGVSNAVLAYESRSVSMKVRSSLKQLKQKDGSVVVRRRGRTFVVNKRNPRWKARQG